MLHSVGEISPCRGTLPPHTLSGLALLRQARDYAIDVDRDQWDFAVEIASLRSAGLNNSDLRWLICKGWVEHSRPGDAIESRLHRSPDLTLTDQSCFILTEAGAQLINALCEPEPRLSDSRRSDAETLRDVPVWDRHRHEIRFRGRVVKQYRLPSPNQETILMAFEEEGWPHRIDDPLPPTPHVDSRQRLHDTIKSLNRNQKNALLRFHGDGTGEGICWSAVGSTTEG